MVGVDVSTERLNSDRHTSKVVSVGTLWRKERERERERGHTMMKRSTASSPDSLSVIRS